MSEKKMRKVKIFKLSKECFLDFFRGNDHAAYMVTQGQLPDDVEVVNARVSWDGFFEVLLYSDTFKENKEGDPVPELPDVVFQTRQCKEYEK